MDAIQMEKLQAMKKYEKNHFLSSFMDYSLKVSMLVLLLSTTIWLSSLKSFFLVSLPSILSAAFTPKCLFIVSNMIVIFLVGESRLAKSEEEPDVYEEYIAKRRSLQGVVVSNVVEDKEEKPLDDIEESKENDVEIVEEIKEEEVKEEEQQKEEEEKQDEDEEEEEEEEEKVEEVLEGEEERGILPADELNRRVEDFIAKVNMQRRLEARMLICCC